MYKYIYMYDIYIYTFFIVYLRVCMNKNLYVCMHECMYAYIYISIHKHIYLYIYLTHCHSTPSTSPPCASPPCGWSSDRWWWFCLWRSLNQLEPTPVTWVTWVSNSNKMKWYDVISWLFTVYIYICVYDFMCIYIYIHRHV